MSVSEKNNSPGQEDVWEDKLLGSQIRGREAVSPTGLQGEGSPKNSVCSQTPLPPVVDSFQTESGQMGSSQKCRDSA